MIRSIMLSFVLFVKPELQPTVTANNRLSWNMSQSSIVSPSSSHPHINSGQHPLPSLTISSSTLIHLSFHHLHIHPSLAEKAMFLSHMTRFYPNHLADFPHKLADLLGCAARTLPSGLRKDLASPLILLINREIVNIKDTLPLFMDLQTLGDKPLRELAFSHVVKSIKRMNIKHKDEAKNRALQNILFTMLQDEDEGRAKRALVTLCDLHKRQIWFDERTTNAICTASFHSSSRILIATLCFLLDYEKIENYHDSDDSDSDEELTVTPQVMLTRETVYKASHQGTSASKKKKKKKKRLAMKAATEELIKKSKDKLFTDDAGSAKRKKAEEEALDLGFSNPLGLC